MANCELPWYSGNIENYEESEVENDRKHAVIRNTLRGVSSFPTRPKNYLEEEHLSAF